jgi:hypothetical protein
MNGTKMPRIKYESDGTAFNRNYSVYSYFPDYNTITEADERGIYHQYKVRCKVGYVPRGHLTRREGHSSWESRGWAESRWGCSVH